MQKSDGERNGAHLVRVVHYLLGHIDCRLPRKASGIPDTNVQPGNRWRTTCSPVFLRMIRSHFEVGKEKRFPGGPLTAAVWLDSHEHGIDLVESLFVVELQDPAFLRSIVLVEHPKFEGLRPV